MTEVPMDCRVASHPPQHPRWPSSRRNSTTSHTICINTKLSSFTKSSLCFIRIFKRCKKKNRQSNTCGMILAVSVSFRCKLAFHIYNFGNEKNSKVPTFIKSLAYGPRPLPEAFFYFIFQFNHHLIFSTFSELFQLKWIEGIIAFHLRPHLLKSNIHVGRRQNFSKENGEVQNIHFCQNIKIKRFLKFFLLKRKLKLQTFI